METGQPAECRLRRYPRIRKRRPVAVYPAGDPRSVTFGTLEMVGRGGALLRCNEPIPTATDAELAICLAGGVIRVRARVLYHLPRDGELAIGVKFLDLRGDGEALLERLVSSQPRTHRTDRASTSTRWPFLLYEPATLSEEPS